MADDVLEKPKPVRTRRKPVPRTLQFVSQEAPITTTPPSPKPGLAPHQLQFILMILLLISVFANGILWTKVQFYEKGATNNKANTAAGANNAGLHPLAPENLKKYASDLKLNTSQFNGCLDTGKYKSAVDADIAQGTSVGVNGTPGFFINGKFLGGAYPIENFKEIIDKELAGTGSTNYKNYSQTLQSSYESPNKSFDPNPKKVDIGNAQTKGNKDAKVTIVEFSDFECPFCERFYQQTLPQIQKDYVDTGKALLVYKEFPLTSIHPHSQTTAEASLCAAEQGKFWEYHDKLFVAMKQG